MCGIVGFLSTRDERPEGRSVLVGMANTLAHRGPDSTGYFSDGPAGLGFRRLSIIDLETGDQPLYNEDESVVLICNGEIYNHRELRRGLEARGHHFKTRSDAEVLLHLYEERGEHFLNDLNGQFAFALYDRKAQRLFLARDQLGVCPLYYTVADGVFIFASEIKGILAHPLVRREVDMTGLDQILSFPGLVSPRTMFKGVESLKSGHYLLADASGVRLKEYWDLDYPEVGALPYDHSHDYYVDRVRETLERSVTYRLQADVPVGFYLSGGLDSSMVAALIKKVSPDTVRHSFSVGFTDKELSEVRHQRLMAEAVSSTHHEIIFDETDIIGRLSEMIYHCECPVKETFNVCSMALSRAARDASVSVVLTGQGADELFAGYMGYRFDGAGMRGERRYGLEAALEEEIRERLWGDPGLFYETDQHAFRDVKTALFSERVNERYDEFDCLSRPLVNKERLRNRHPIHQRSYLDFKLRLEDHLLIEHGERMAMANSVEARHPFLDINLVELAMTVPPELKLNGLTEKYILREAARDLIPRQIIEKEKFGFRAPAGAYLMQQNSELIQDTLSSERIRRQDYFNPAAVERIKALYSQPGFKLNPHTEVDLLMVVLTFGLFLEQFRMPNFN
ncbi:MAG: asparagine synthase (glutamine-hydrolyzing) [Pyrinomonadaceae bacterium]